MTTLCTGDWHSSDHLGHYFITVVVVYNDVLVLGLCNHHESEKPCEPGVCPRGDQVEF